MQILGSIFREIERIMRFGMISSHWSLKSRSSQRAYVKVWVIQTAFHYSPVVLYPVHVNETHVVAELTILLLWRIWWYVLSDKYLHI
jgi:hypothetical protein